MTQPPRLHASESMQAITDALQEHGVVIVEDLLDQDLLTRFMPNSTAI